MFTNRGVFVALRLPDRWVWDSWFVWDQDVCHAFYLCASRGLGDPERRHRNPNVGHAISKDLKNWEILPDALSPSESPAFDSWTTWTGSTIKGPDGKWWMFYTGTSREGSKDIQRIGAAVSEDLISWEKLSSEALVEADPRWYEELDLSIWHDQAWRDPWVFQLPDSQDQLWHMLITARANHGDPKGRGVVGHAVSADLTTWEVLEPLSEPGAGFGQLEVFQFEVVDTVPVVLFCCGWRELEKDRLELHGKEDGVYSFTCNSDLSGMDVSKSVQFPDTSLYAARLVQDRSGGWNLIGFKNIVEGKFVGELSDPIPVTAVAGVGIVPKG
jgi:beta-fructofuranosidase